MDVPFPGGWRYALGATCGWLLFLAALLGVTHGRTLGWPLPALAALALVPAAVAAAQFHTAYRLVAAQDEFVRALFAKRMLAAGALAILLATAWSCLELIGAPHLPAWLLYPLVWGLFGMVTPLIRGTRP